MTDIDIFSLVIFFKFIEVWYFELGIEMSLAILIIMFLFIHWISEIVTILFFIVPILTIFLCVICFQSWDFDFCQLWLRCVLTFENSCCVPSVTFRPHMTKLLYLKHTKYVYITYKQTILNTLCFRPCLLSIQHLFELKWTEVLKFLSSKVPLIFLTLYFVETLRAVS